SIALVAVAATAIPVLLIQYKSRRTLLSRWLAIGGMAVAALAFAAMPWPVALAVQSRLSKKPGLGAAIQAAPGHGSEQPYWQAQPGVTLNIPISMQGLPPESEMQADALTVSLHASDGRTTSLSAVDCPHLRRATTSTSSVTLYATCFPDPEFYNQ